MLGQHPASHPQRNTVIFSTLVGGALGLVFGLMLGHPLISTSFGLIVGLVSGYWACRN